MGVHVCLNTTHFSRHSKLAHRIQINHLSTALVSLLLLPLLVQTAEKYGTNPRLTVTASDVHLNCTFKPDVLQSPRILEKLSDREYCTSR
jgi:retinol dehydrogenase 12